MEEEPQNGNGNVNSDAVADDDAEAMVGPAPPAPRARAKRPLQFEQTYLNSLPSANMYACLSSICQFQRFRVY